MTAFRFTFSAKIFSREHLDAPQVPVETYQGIITAESYAAVEEKSGVLIGDRCNEHELKTGLMVGFEKLRVEIDDSPTDRHVDQIERIRHAAKRYR